ncbi:hypothetical protein CEXT_292111 [Caerostris extrusa]|uniref:Uncharacterized protein n=1 Tax=Caerostris extrusa TaxID=172846 RepID=A0AAV4SRF6_CAEEX|nr:hypothetical protein CEXT_292111 [Caerostris extrusa]
MAVCPAVTFGGSNFLFCMRHVHIKEEELVSCGFCFVYFAPWLPFVENPQKKDEREQRVCAASSQALF